MADITMQETKARLAIAGLDTTVTRGMVIQVIVTKHKMDGNGNTIRWMKILAPIEKDGRQTCVDITWKVATVIGNRCRTSKTGSRTMTTSNTPQEIVGRLASTMFGNSTVLYTEAHT